MLNLLKVIYYYNMFVCYRSAKRAENGPQNRYKILSGLPGECFI